MAAAPDASQLRQALDDNLKRVIDLFRDWDRDCSGTVSKRGFVRLYLCLVYDAEGAGGCSV